VSGISSDLRRIDASLRLRSLALVPKKSPHPVSAQTVMKRMVSVVVSMLDLLDLLEDSMPS
jgi:hypothetical protein